MSLETLLTVAILISSIGALLLAASILLMD